MATIADRARGLRARWSALLDGEVTPWPYSLFRVAIAALILVRTTDWLRPVAPLLHHSWVQGLEYDPGVEDVLSPVLRSPLIPGLVIGDGLARVLVWARTGLAALLLIGLRARTVAAALALVGFALMAADRYRYFHHLLLLWTGVGWLALAPSAERLSVRRWFPGSGPVQADWVPRWPLQLMRLYATSVYLAAGLAKLSSDWLGGKILAELTTIGFIRGRNWNRLVGLVGVSPLAIAIAAAELGLPILLAMPRTRLPGVILGLGLHLGISTAMNVSTFGLQMVLFLSLFLPWPWRTR